MKRLIVSAVLVAVVLLVGVVSTPGGFSGIAYADGGDGA